MFGFLLFNFDIVRHYARGRDGWMKFILKLLDVLLEMCNKGMFVVDDDDALQLVVYSSTPTVL